MTGKSEFISANEVEEDLFRLGEVLEVSKVVKNPYVLFNASERVREKSRMPGADWIIALEHDNPLIFKESRCQRGRRISPDVYCLIAGKEEGQAPILTMNVVMRFWSDNEDLYYRDDWDAPSVKERVEISERGSRVMLRCHFDLGQQSSDGEPRYHMQVGGVVPDPLQENCWFSSKIRVPRFPMAPTDLVLAIEIILSSFFPKTYLEMQETIEWRRLVFKSEFHFLREYLKDCANTASIPIDRRLRIGDNSVLRQNWMAET